MTIQVIDAPERQRYEAVRDGAVLGFAAYQKTAELIAYVAAVLGVLIASAVVDTSDFGAQEAWFYITLLTIGYLVSRGLAKSGSRDFYDDYADNNR